MARGGKRLPKGWLVALAGLGPLVAIALVAPAIWGHEAVTSTPHTLLGMGEEGHVLGTDEIGRDILARTLVATRLTLVMALIATTMSALVGIPLGAATALLSRHARGLAARLIDLLVALPTIILALTVVAILGPGTDSTVLAIGIAFSPIFARLSSTLSTSVAARGYVVTARLLGVGKVRMFTRHVLPNIADSLMVMITVGFGSTVVAISALSFLGVGVQPPDYDWGDLLQQGLQNVYVSPGGTLGPAFMILVTTLAVTFVGENLGVAVGRAQHGEAEEDAENAEEAELGAETVSHAAGADATGDDDLVLQVRDLRVWGAASGKRLVKGVSFVAAPGEVVGIVGESGSGKTLMSLATAQLLPVGLEAAAGAVRIAGRDVAGGDSKEIRRHLATKLGLVFQDPLAHLNPCMRLGAQLTELPRTHLGLSRREANDLAEQWLGTLQVSEPHARMSQFPHELSGGIRQRAMLAMELMKRPELLIADEPTTALDVTTQAEVIQLLRDINLEHRTAMLFISHNLGVVAQLCDRVLVMQAGAIVEEASIDALRRGELTHPYSRRLQAATPTLPALLDPMIGPRSRQ